MKSWSYAPFVGSTLDQSTKKRAYFDPELMTSSTFEGVGTPLTLTPGAAARAAGTRASTPSTASSRQRIRGPTCSIAAFASVGTPIRLNVLHRGWTRGRYGSLLD